MWFQIIMLVISIALKVLSYLLRPKPPKPQGAEPGTLEGKIPTAEEGEQIPVVFGMRWVTPNVVWWEPVGTEEITKNSNIGGKGGK